MLNEYRFDSQRYARLHRLKNNKKKKKKSDYTRTDRIKRYLWGAKW